MFCLFCIKMRSYFVHKNQPCSDHLYIGSMSLFTCVHSSYANSSSQFKISLSLALMDLFLLWYRHRPLLLKREKYQLLYSHLPRSPGPAWQLASLLPLQLGPDVTLPLNSLVEEFSAGFALSQPLTSCQSISLS